ncbi:MAG TPA: ABC transporter substrate-binding protein, partial [Trueperaceae bacterium]
TSFHVEASAAMYLDALAISFKKAGQQRCFVIHADTDDGAALKDRAQDALTRNGIDAAGVAGVAPGQPVYSPEFDAIRKAEADVVLVLLGARDQIAFLSQYDSMGPDIALAPYPHPVTQTRDYFATASYLAHKAGSGRRMVLWETTLQAHGAGPLNEDYMAHWGAPMNPTAWAAYQAIKMLVETVQVTGTTEASQLIAHLENPTTVFDVAKGPGTSFRPWDHQLRQPLYLDDIDAEAEYGITLTQLLPIAKFVGEIPDMEGEAGNRMERLDKLGDGPGTSPCKF